MEAASSTAPALQTTHADDNISKITSTTSTTSTTTSTTSTTPIPKVSVGRVRYSASISAKTDSSKHEAFIERADSMPSSSTVSKKANRQKLKMNFATPSVKSSKDYIVTISQDDDQIVKPTAAISLTEKQQRPLPKKFTEALAPNPFNENDVRLTHYFKFGSIFTDFRCKSNTEMLVKTVRSTKEFGDVANLFNASHISLCRQGKKAFAMSYPFVPGHEAHFHFWDMLREHEVHFIYDLTSVESEENIRYYREQDKESTDLVLEQRTLDDDKQELTLDAAVF